jgi:protein-tyrosine kinase
MRRRDRSAVLTNATLHTQFAEAYRVLRSNLNVSRAGEESRAILVTSAGPGEGKSTTVANLAILMAKAGHRVAAVDADFRQPGLHALLDAEPRPVGLSELIAGSAALVEVAAPSSAVENLFLISTGAIPSNPSELLGSGQMKVVLEHLRRQADVILLDTPPCAVYADAFELAQLADGILYVLRSGPQGINHLRTLKQLQQGRARLIGIVMNQAESGAGRAYSTYRKGALVNG